MKRRWSIVRIMVAVLLGALAWGVYALWPNAPLLSVVNEEAVGFDEAKGLFYSTTLEVKDQQVRTYDLTSSVLVSSQVFQGPPSIAHWPLALAPDGRFVIPMSAMQGILPALKLPSLQAANGERPLTKSWPRAFGFSPDGKLLLFQDLKIEDDKETVTIWDIARNQTYDRIVLPHEPVSLSWGSSNSLPSHSIAITGDRRYVAAKLIDGSFVVYDRDERRTVLQLKDAHVIPRFTNAGNTLVLVPDIRYGKSQPIQWYELEQGKWTLQGRTTVLQGELGRILQMDEKHLVTQEVHDLPDWLIQLPESVRSFVENRLLHRKMTLRFMDLQTGEIVKTVAHRLPINYTMLFLPDSEICCSSSSKYYSQETDRILKVWSTSPRRSWLCWLVAGGILFFGIWVGIPRSNREQFTQNRPVETNPKH